MLSIRFLLSLFFSFKLFSFGISKKTSEFFNFESVLENVYNKYNKHKSMFFKFKSKHCLSEILLLNLNN